MKYATFILALGFLVLTSCNSSAQDEARQTASAIQEAAKAYGPGKVATSDSGYTMQAVIDGKAWKALSMMEINASNDHYIHGEDNDIQISFYIDRDHPYLGKERKLGKGHAADLRIGDHLWGAHEGGYAITKIDDAAIEGRFHFTAKLFQSDKTMEVTDGVFRVLLDANQ